MGERQGDAATSALSGLKVVELCDAYAGAYCGKLLADLGAEVIKVEPPAGDQARSVGPFPHDLPNPEQSGTFFYLNTNKLGITLNIEDRAGQNIVQALIAQADVLIEDRAPGALDALGIKYEALTSRNPGLVIISITPFGQSGPYKDFKAYPITTFHAGGEGYTLPGALGWLLYSDRPPLKTAGVAGEYSAGLMAGVATLMAVLARDLTGTGQHIDFSEQEALMNLSRAEVEKYPNDNFIERRATRMFPMGGLFQCKDGFIQMGVNDRTWTGLVELLGNPEWAEDEGFSTRVGRAERGEFINEKIADWTIRQNKYDVYSQAQAKGMTATPVLSPADLYSSPQLRARGYFVETERPDGQGTMYMPSAAYQLSATPWKLRRPAPRLGQHNLEVLGQRLGYSNQDIVRLRGDGVI